ncbi:D-alanyl-D-alanine carboxypeptidase [Leucobacter exalbidus]|uniref:D-alanyl-D-alanine carboxypeptidase n=1 Tax=Leucobacter exalbidus TaxID=662960 RepID=A0A940Q002_9MICO|nr:M15 family metallopeptidase [Leucobacter exalbidus]MBP1327221.1 D-alanyl-D-alanine carboxypeptidase [Leucobacter exalbidus]
MTSFQLRGAVPAFIALMLAGSLAACGAAPEPEARAPKKPAAEQAAEAKAKQTEEAPAAEPVPEAPGAESPAPIDPDQAAPAAPDLVSPGFDRALHSIDDPMSIWVVGNKLRPLTPENFEPTDLVPTQGVANDNGQPLREATARAVEQFIAGASEAGHDVRIISAYRNYDLQVQLYNGYIVRDGQAAADTYSARPGHSEHQTGLTVDLDDYGTCYLAACFGETPAGQWLAANAADYGFIVRYPSGKEPVTGFTPEPWHFRYVGTELAGEMRATGVSTLEEFFGLPVAPGYAE